jgi:prepilin-type N-terminal cleavage/methylation domain-containing protein
VRHSFLLTGKARPGAFTLIELLVVVAVVALLVALALPAIAGVRRSAREAQSLSNLRGIGQSMQQYCGTYRTYPFGYFGWARPPESGLFGYGFGIWMIHNSWPVVMHDVAPWREHALTWLSPGADPRRFLDTWSGPFTVFTPGTASYRYSLSFVGNPRLWDGHAAADPSLAVAQKDSSVGFPSQKVLAFDFDRAYLTGRQRDSFGRPVGMADGSAALRRDSDAAVPVQNPLSGNPPQAYLDTPMGVQGQDFK